MFYLPLDFRFTVRRYMEVVRPRLMVLMESELWPNLLQECVRREVPVAVVNARVSDRSFPRYMRLRRLWRPLLRGVSLFLAQGEETAGRLRAIGVEAERVRVTGNLKYDLRDVAETPMVGSLRRAMPEGARVLVCGSTLEGEEEMLLAAWPEVLASVRNAVMVLAPRHPERFGRVLEIAGAQAKETGRRVWRASDLREGTAAFGAGDVVVLDTIGDLAGVYSLADVAFVGGSLVAGGGHNPLEPARFGVPVVIGSSFINFREIVERLQAMNGIRVVTPVQVGAALRDLMADEEAARGLGERGRGVFAAEAGATTRTVKELLGLLGDGDAEGGR